MTAVEQEALDVPPPPPEPVGEEAVHAPSREDPLVAKLSAFAGGPGGRFLADPQGRWRAGTVLVLLAVATLAVSITTKAHCIRRGWSTPDQLWHMCYSDLPALYGSASLGGRSGAGLGEALPKLGQPPLSGAIMWLVAQVVPSGSANKQALWFFDASVLLLSLALVAAVIAVVTAARRRGWDAAHLALSPVLVTAAFISYDLVAVCLLAWGLLVWSRMRPVAAGVLLGLAMGVRPVYMLVGVAVLALALRSGRWRAAGLATGTALVVWFGVRVLVLPGFTGGLSTAWTNWRNQGPGFGSIWFLPELVARARPRATTAWPRQGLTGPTVTMLALIALAVVVGGALTLALGTQERPRLAHVTLFVVAGALLFGKAIPPQAGVLLLPLIALSALRWRDHLLWAGAEVSYWMGVWLYIAASSDSNRGLTPALYAILIAVRAAGLVWIMICAVRAARDPLLDPVRCPPEGLGRDDPLGGPFEDTTDALVVRMT